MKKSYPFQIFFFLYFFQLTSLEAQSVGINTPAPDASAVLEIKSTDKGMLIPRMQKFQRLGIQNPAEGLLVFDIDSDAFWYFQDVWIRLSDESKNVWLKEGTLAPAEIGDTAMYYSGQIGIGKDTSLGQVTIYNEKENGLYIHSETDNEDVTAGIRLLLEGTGSAVQHGLRMDMSGNVISRVGTSVWSTNNDNSTNLVYGSQVNLSYSPSITDSSERQLIGSNNQLTGYDNIYQVGGFNRLQGTSFGRQRGTINLLEAGGDGQQIGTYNILSNGGNGEHIGTFNKTDGIGEGDHFGTKNELDGASNLYGTYTIVDSPNNDSLLYGMHNQILGRFNDGDHYGVSNQLNASGSGKRFGVSNELSGSGDGRQYGTYNLINNTGPNNQYGIVNEMEGTASGYQFGSFQYITNNGTGVHTGSQNTLVGTGAGAQIGTANTLSTTGDGNHFGIRTYLDGGGDGAHYGSFTSIAASGMGPQYADWSGIINNEDGEHYGEYTYLNGSGAGIHHGSNLILTGSGSGPQYGHLVEITNTGDAAHYGNRAILDGAGNGFQYGTSNVIANTGSSAHYGTHNNLIGPATGTQFATFNLIDVTGNGNHFGTYNQISGSGTGAHFAGYFDAIGPNSYAAVFGNGKVVVNEIGGDYDFRVESDNNNSMLFVDASANGVGIGTSLPESQLDVKGGAIVERNSNSSNPHLTLREIGADYARLSFQNTEVDTTYWTAAGRTNHNDASSRFNFYYNQSGNVLSLHGDGDAVVQKRLLVGSGEPEAVIHAKSTGSSQIFKLENNSQDLFRVSSSGNIAIGGPASGNDIYTVYMPTKVSLGVANPFYRFSLPNSNVEGIGLAIARNWMEYSDRRVKTNVVDSEYGLKEILALRPVTYDHHSSLFGEHGLELKEDFSREVGFLAQDVYQIIEDVVHKPEDENKDLWSMDYERLTPVLVKAIQELNEENIEMKKQLIQLINNNNELTSQLNNQQIKFNQELEEIKKALDLE